MYGNGGGTIWDYFCNHRCLMDFVDKHTQAMLNIEPRLEALETPIHDPVKKTYDNGYYEYTRTEIKEMNKTVKSDFNVIFILNYITN